MASLASSEVSDWTLLVDEVFFNFNFSLF